jgi:phage-related protein
VPKTRVLLFREADGRIPVREWLDALGRRDRRALAKCVDRVERLAELGHELRRPEAGFLRDGLYELRVLKGHVNYRILYFFHGKDVVVLAHALTKEDVIPDADIQRASARKRLVEANPRRHLHED